MQDARIISDLGNGKVPVCLNLPHSINTKYGDLELEGEGNELLKLCSRNWKIPGK
jgi:hypothetical protein